MTFQTTLTYPVTIEPVHADKDLIVRCRDFPELVTHGRDTDDALLMAADALMTCLEHRASVHERIPLPSRRRLGEYSVMPTWVSHKATPAQRQAIVAVLKRYSNIEEPHEAA